MSRICNIFLFCTAPIIKKYSPLDYKTFLLFKNLLLNERNTIDVLSTALFSAFLGIQAPAPDQKSENFWCAAVDPARQGNHMASTNPLRS